MANTHSFIMSTDCSQDLPRKNNPSLVLPECDTSQVAKKTEKSTAKMVLDKSVKAHQCTYCPKSFTRPSALKTHMYTHTNEKPFQCSNPNCGRRFSVVSNLRRHSKVHQRVFDENNNNQKMTARDRIQRVRQLIMKSKTAVVVNIESEKLSLPDNRSLFYAVNSNHNFSGTKMRHPLHNYNHYLLLPPILNGENNFNSIVSTYPTPSSVTTEDNLAPMATRNNEKFFSPTTKNNHSGNNDFNGDDKDISNSPLFSENDFLYLYTNHHIFIENHTSTNTVSSRDYQQ